MRFLHFLGFWGQEYLEFATQKKQSSQISSDFTRLVFLVFRRVFRQNKTASELLDGFLFFPKTIRRVKSEETFLEFRSLLSLKMFQTD